MIFPNVTLTMILLWSGTYGEIASTGGMPSFSGVDGRAGAMYAIYPILPPAYVTEHLHK
jgi:hypothetical protein